MQPLHGGIGAPWLCHVSRRFAEDGGSAVFLFVNTGTGAFPFPSGPFRRQQLLSFESNGSLSLLLTASSSAPYTKVPWSLQPCLCQRGRRGPLAAPRREHTPGSGAQAGSQTFLVTLHECVWRHTCSTPQQVLGERLPEKVLGLMGGDLELPTCPRPGRVGVRGGAGKPVSLSPRMKCCFCMKKYA